MTRKAPFFSLNFTKAKAACFLLMALLFTQSPFAQSSVKLKKKGITRAVIVGISDYQDSSIADLSYAHRDAEAFAAFLQTKSGGQLKDQQLKLLTNEQATLARIEDELIWLLKKSKKNDLAIIYFSGHGDVETRNEKEKGYLIAFDTPYNNYPLNALDIEYLNKQIIGEISRKGCKVIVITDACHSGTLSGNANKGREFTSMELMKRFSNEIKIMSCQPYELSLESAEWGGGRGVFSYYLINGLKSLADEDKDRRVDLYELEDSLQDQVRRSTEKQQHPDIFGGKKQESLFLVDEAAVEELRPEQEMRVQGGIEESVLKNLASEEAYLT